MKAIVDFTTSSISGRYQALAFDLAERYATPLRYQNASARLRSGSIQLRRHELPQFCNAYAEVDFAYHIPADTACQLHTTLSISGQSLTRSVDWANAS
jgi:hypothetical protein